MRICTMLKNAVCFSIPACIVLGAFVACNKKVEEAFTEEKFDYYTILKVDDEVYTLHKSKQHDYKEYTTLCGYYCSIPKFASSGLVSNSEKGIFMNDVKYWSCKNIEDLPRDLINKVEQCEECFEQ